MKCILLCAAAAHAAAPTQLLLNWRASPVVGVEGPNLLLIWSVPPDQKQQSSARIQLFSTAPPSLLWDYNASSPYQNITYSGSALRNASHYAWRVCTADERGSISEWSDNATFVTGVWSQQWQGAAPVWSKNATAAFVFLRAGLQVTDPSELFAAVAYITANPQPNAQGEHENAKLLGAYKLYINGRQIGLGPGRPGRCGPVCPVGSGGGTCTCSQEHLYDSYDVSADVSSGGGTMALAIQAFNYPPSSASAPAVVDSKVMLQLVLTYRNGSQLITGTGPHNGWKAWEADGYMNKSCCTAQQWYFAPRENYIASLEPVGWRLPGFDDSAWEPAAVAVPFNPSYPLTARPTLPISVTTGVKPALVQKIADGHWFIDMGREIQGGLSVSFSNASEGQYLYARYGEALLPKAHPNDPSAVMYEMSTGNSYWMGWSLRNSSSSSSSHGADDFPVVIENHEYLEWRYAELVAQPVPTYQCVESDHDGTYKTPVTLTCADPAAVITGVSFASWGTPRGHCVPGSADGANSFAVNASCNYDKSVQVIESLCVGKKASCSFVPSDSVFGNFDPCDKVVKWLGAAVTCNNSSPLPPLPPAAYPGWVPDVSAWVVVYPAAYVTGDGGNTTAGSGTTSGGTVTDVGASQVHVSDPSLQAVWELCHYTAVATTLDMYTDSNTRQRSVICSEAVLINLLMQYATSVEWAQQAYTLDYILNHGPYSLGWAEWQALSIIAVHTAWMHTGDLSMFTRRYEQLRNFTELPLVSKATGLWTCDSANSWDCNHPEIDW